MHSALSGNGDWNAGLIALTRLAELRTRAYADSARAMRRRLQRADFPPFPANPGLKAEDVLPSLQAILLERRRAVQGDSAVLADILRRIPTKNYDHGDAWVLGRLGAGAADSVSARFQAAETEEFRVRYLTLLSYFTDPRLIPLLTRVYIAPDSFEVPKRYAIRASDGLLWIGTVESLKALLDARSRARQRGTYADSTLVRGGYDFLANDSSAVISRTGKWLTEWVRELGAGLGAGRQSWELPASSIGCAPGGSGCGDTLQSIRAPSGCAAPDDTGADAARAAHNPAFLPVGEAIR
jgi:hypothetical protein